MTEPLLTCPITFDGTGPQFTVTYSDTSTNNVTIPAGTYYPDGSGSADDLLVVLSTAFSSACDGTWVISNPSSGLLFRTVFSKSGASKSPTLVACLDHAQYTGQDAGFNNSTTTGSATIAMTGGVTATGETVYQRAGVWLPRDMLLATDTDIMRTIALSTGPSGAGVVDDYGGYTTRQVIIGPAIPAACVKQIYADDSGYIGAVSGLTVRDPNVTLERWLVKLRDQLSGTIPTLRLAVDATAPATYTSVRFVDARFYRSINAWVGEPTTRAPLQWGAVLDLAVV